MEIIESTVQYFSNKSSTLILQCANFNTKHSDQTKFKMKSCQSLLNCLKCWFCRASFKQVNKIWTRISKWFFCLSVDFISWFFFDFLFRVFVSFRFRGPRSSWTALMSMFTVRHFWKRQWEHQVLGKLKNSILILHRNWREWGTPLFTIPSSFIHGTISRSWRK